MRVKRLWVVRIGYFLPTVCGIGGSEPAWRFAYSYLFAELIQRVLNLVGDT
jgi:hypothetical protein